MVVFLNYVFFTIFGFYKHETLSLLCDKCRILQLHLSRTNQNVRIHVGKKNILFNLSKCFVKN
jgi:hypothetical protein